MARGERLTEILKQDQYKPLSAAQQIVSIFAGVRGLLDDLPVSSVRKFLNSLLTFVEEKHPELYREIEDKKKIDDPLEQKITEAVKECKGLFKS